MTSAVSPRAWWNINNVQETNRPVEDVLAAAIVDLRADLAWFGLAQPAITVELRLADHGDKDPPPAVSVTVAGGRMARIPLTAIRAAAAGEVLPTTLLACALARPLGEDWVPVPVGTGDPPARSRIDDYRIGPMTTQVTIRLHHNLHAGVDTVVCGDQASGAAELVAAWARARDASDDCGLVWLSLSDAADGPESIYQTLLAMPQHGRYLVVVNGVQSNPHALKRIRDCVDDIRALGLKMTLVATAWPSVVARLSEPFQHLRQINADGSELVNRLLADAALTPRERVAFEKLVGDNVHLAVAALGVYATDRQVPTLAQLRSAVTGGTTDEELQQALYWFACLSVLEVDIPVRLAEARFAPELIQRLVDQRLLWLSDGAYTIGSRARAGLVLQRALREWNAEPRWGDPARVVWRHLNEAGEATMMAMLERMDLVGLISDPAAPDVTRHLAACWHNRARLLHSLTAHYLEHGTWNDCVGADVFAAMVFAETGNLAAWRAVATRLRGRFDYSGSDLPAVVGEPTSDIRDFDAIREAMSVEETQHQPLAGHELAEKINVEPFYLTWVLGLLLGLEGNAPEPGPDRVRQLVAIAAAAQDARDGWFYPRRVPWNTARVVLGLCQAGQTYDGNDVVHRACDWLRRPVAEGGALERWWHSGTGQWNTDEMTTAMCLTALHRAGAPMHSSMRIALAWLLEQRAEWRRPNHEIDLALVVETLLLYRIEGQDLQDGVLALLQWALNVPDNGLPHIDNAIPEDNLRLPFVVAQLTVVIRATMTQQLRAVVDHELRQYRTGVGGGGPSAPGGAPANDPAHP